MRETDEELEQEVYQESAASKLREATVQGFNSARQQSRNAQLINAANGNKQEQKPSEKPKQNNNQQMVNPINHQKPENLGVQTPNASARPNGSNTGDVGARNLRNSLAKAKNLFKPGRKSKKNKTKDKNSNNSADNSSNDTSDDSDSIGDKIAAKLAQRFKVKIIIFAIVIFGGFLIIIALLGLIMGGNIADSLPVLGPSAYDSGNFESSYDKNSKQYKDEINYYKKLQEVSKNYEKKYGEELKTNYIHSFLIYLYYRVDLSEIDKNKKDIDYSKLSSKVDQVVELMKPSDTSKSIDYEKKGEFYNNLKSSSFFFEYYKLLLREEKAEDILDEIFDLANEIDQIDIPDETVVTEETKVEYKEPPTSSEKPKTKTLTIKEYIADSIYATTDKISNSELVKAYTVTFSTNIVSENKKLTISSNTASANNVLCSTTEGCSYDSKGNLVSGGGSQSTKNAVYYKGKYYYKSPLSKDEQTSLNSSISSVFGNVVVNSDGTYSNLDWSKLGGLGDGNYKDILTEAYGEVKYKNVGENSYILDASYGTKQVKTPIIAYDQKDYSSYKFCGLKSSTIGGSGCGVTSMAMIASTYTGDKKYDPVYMNNEAKKMGLCSYSGTSQSFFGREASKLGFKYSGGTKYNKSFLNNVLKHLSQGHLVVAHMGKGHFTGGGHYMVLGGVDPQSQKVYVYDSNNRSNKANKKTGNGWYSFNDIIVKEAYHFYIIWR